MDNRHLWLRSRKRVAVGANCNAIIYATYEFFDKNGFMKFDSPILFRKCCVKILQNFSKQTTLGTPPICQSGQLYLEAGAIIGRVF